MENNLVELWKWVMVPSNAKAADSVGGGWRRAKPTRRQGISMNPRHRDDQRGTIHWRADEAAMDTFTLRLPGGRSGAAAGTLPTGPHHRSDRGTGLRAGCRGDAARRPITAAVGTAVYDSSRHVYAEQAHTRHTVTATVTDVPATQGSCGQVRPKCRPDGLPPAPNTPARSRLNGQPSLVKPLRSGSTTTERRSPHRPRPPAPPRKQRWARSRSG